MGILHLHKLIHLTTHTHKIHTRHQSRHIKPNMSPFGGGACGAGGGGQNYSTQHIIHLNQSLQGAVIIFGCLPES